MKQNGKIIGPRWLSGAVIKCESTIRAKEGLVGVVKSLILCSGLKQSESLTNESKLS